MMKKSMIALIFCVLPFWSSAQFVGVADETISAPTDRTPSVERVRGPTAAKLSKGQGRRIEE